MSGARLEKGRERKGEPERSVPFVPETPSGVGASVASNDRGEHIIQVDGREGGSEKTGRKRGENAPSAVVLPGTPAFADALVAESVETSVAVQTAIGESEKREGKREPGWKG